VRVQLDTYLFGNRTNLQKPVYSIDQHTKKKKSSRDKGDIISSLVVEEGLNTEKSQLLCRTSLVGA